ncbi:hypothetical protein HMPREF1531_01375 [Propionibacterium sp. oral taxon 192 str. F0372]|uniref:TetR/AcrR family transcriptional regulator n=1 Tax=Propionibacterium sp. oral taxon 192 TaxID=671222 RepID=UPI0003538E29|nr:TetR/AcrR family transcriptional regulator [Propionibacterium sp. oral taxon 192]EPH03316.1 hypothetical protein HMPREF1531_01375 [Propionibacterium sp. oral taxon 192 str. F0372]
MKNTTTRERLRSTALRLFTEHGFEQVTVNQIAQTVGVSHMTYFRYFPTKESVIVEDFFDPVIARAVAAQDPGLPPLHRAVRGLLAALTDETAQEELSSEEFALRIKLVAITPSLRGAAMTSSRATQEAIAESLETPGVDRFLARSAAAAVIAAATQTLLDWAGEHHPTPPCSAAQALVKGLSILMDQP